MSALYLHGMGHFHPENVITNSFLEEMDIGTTETWIMERVGIHTRRTVLPLDYIKETKNRDPREAFAAGLSDDVAEIRIEVQVLLHAEVFIEAELLRHVADAFPQRTLRLGILA